MALVPSVLLGYLKCLFFLHEHIGLIGANIYQYSTSIRVKTVLVSWSHVTVDTVVVQIVIVVDCYDRSSRGELRASNEKTISL